MPADPRLNHPFSTRRLAVLAVFAALAVAIHWAEGFLPPPLPVPGVKLGLANAVTLLVMVTCTPAEAFAVLLVRILIGSLLLGQAMGFLYSLAGGVCCFLMMLLLLRLLERRALPLVSLFGALAHNAAQLVLAVIFTGTPGVFSYVPLLALSACATGLFIGLAAHFTLPLLKRLSL